MTARIWMVLALAGFLLVGVQELRLKDAQLDTARLETSVAKERTAAAAQRADKQAATRAVEQDLNQSAAQTRKVTNAQVRNLIAQRDGLLARVLRAEAAASPGVHLSGASTTAGDRQAPSGGDGAELLATLGEPDVREAERAETIRLHLAACYAEYDRAKTALKALGARP